MNTKYLYLIGLIVILGLLLATLLSPEGTTSEDMSKRNDDGTLALPESIDTEENITILEEKESSGWETYTNEGLAVAVGIPPEWEFSDQSKPGKYTFRIFKDLPNGNSLRFDVRFYLAKIDVGLEEVFKGSFDERDAYYRDITTCTQEEDVACAMTLVRIPLEDGAYTAEADGTIRRAMTVDVKYGAFREFDRDALQEEGVNVGSSDDINAHFNLVSEFENNKAILEEILETFSI